MPEIQIPGAGISTEQHAQELFKAPAVRKDLRWEREQQRTTQARLLEALRYKGYVRRGTLDNLLQRIGGFARRHGWWMFALFWLLLAGLLGR